jgi:hypothetical protein
LVAASAGSGFFFATNNGVWLLAFTLGDATQVVSERVNV